MAVSARRAAGLHFLPKTPAGVAACGLFALSLLLFAARVLLTPTFGLRLTYLAGFMTMAGSGLLALYATAFARERSLASFLALIAGLVAATFLIAETFGQGPPNGPILGEAANGKTFTVQKGAQIMIQLPGNPTTGYTWEPAISDPSVLHESSAPVYKPVGGALGAGGTYTFWYQATTSGQSELTLLYRRSWETDVAPLKTFTVTIVVP